MRNKVVLTSIPIISMLVAFTISGGIAPFMGTPLKKSRGDTRAPFLIETKTPFKVLHHESVEPSSPSSFGASGSKRSTDPNGGTTNIVTTSEETNPTYVGDNIALLTGIGNYDDTDQPTLPSRKNIQHWKELLDNESSVAPEGEEWEYHVLFNENATRENIRNHIEALKECEDEPSDRVLFVWVGHGSYSSDRDDVDPYSSDGRSADDESQIVLDNPSNMYVNSTTLEEWFNHETWNSEHSLFEFSSCHAAGINAGTGMGILADHTGSFVAMASDALGSAYHDDSVGVGEYFGHFFVEGLKDGSVSSAFSYAKDKASFYAEKYNGENQNPQKKTNDWSKWFFQRHDVAVTSIQPDIVPLGGSVTVDVTVENQAGNPEDTTLQLNDVTDDHVIGTRSISLSAGESKTISLTWNTLGKEGAHTLEAKLANVNNEWDTEDNAFTCTVTINDPNLAITDLDAQVMTGDFGLRAILVVVTVENQGNLKETDVTLEVVDSFDDTRKIESISLAAGEANTYSFSFNATGETGTHRIEAMVETIPHEDKTSDNTEHTYVTVD